MKTLSRDTKLKLLMPIAYLCLAAAYIAVTWPNNFQPYHLVGATITVLSFTCWIVARIQLGNAFTLAPEAKYLVKTGFYRKLRHPVYYFSILAVVGLGLYIWSLYLIIPIVALIILEGIRIQKEEAILAKAFGDDYARYKAETWF